jgi:hypothetical protein
MGPPFRFRPLKNRLSLLRVLASGDIRGEGQYPMLASAEQSEERYANFSLTADKFAESRQSEVRKITLLVGPDRQRAFVDKKPGTAAGGELVVHPFGNPGDLSAGVIRHPPPVALGCLPPDGRHTPRKMARRMQESLDAR